VIKALRPLLVLGSASTVTIILGVLTNKYYALQLGPEGLGMIGLFQSFLQLYTLFGGMGISTGIVRSIAGFVNSDNQAQIRAYKTAMWQLFGISALIILTISLILHEFILKLLIPDQNVYTLFSIVGVSIISIASGMQLGFINAHHRTSTLAKIAILSQIAGSVIGILVVWIWSSAAIPFIMVTGPVVSLLLANLYAPRATQGVSSPEDVKLARLKLLNFGVPYLGSSIVGTGVLVILPFVVNHQLQERDVGYYRAASLLSTGYLGGLVTALSQDYFPRISAIQREKESLIKIVNEQLTILLVCATPLIAMVMLFLPAFIRLVFTDTFAPAIDILRWQLLGDIFKIIGWVFAFLILAVAPAHSYLIIEGIGGGLILLFSIFGISIFGLQGIGIAYLVSYFLYACITVYLSITVVKMKINKINLALASLSFIVCATLSIMRYG
jgi:O-antigen/teichoic acid export membrane protein